MEIKMGKYRHFKGNEYEVVAVAKHSEKLEEMVVYRSLKDKNEYWVRPSSMWNETVNYGNKKVKRFEYIGE